MRIRPGFATLLELRSMAKMLGSDQMSLMRNRGIIQLATAAEITLGEPHSSRWDAFVSAERVLSLRYILAVENFATSGSGGPFSWEEEHSLKEAIVDAILENRTAANFSSFMWGSWDDEETGHDNKLVRSDMQMRLELRDRVDHVIKIFHKLSSLKRRVLGFSEGLLTLESNFTSDAYTGRGLLYKRLTMALANYDIIGLEYHSSAVGRFLKSGFGRFGLGQVAKPKLVDQSVLLIFVVGGINGREVHEAWEAVSESSGPDVELILGGTTLLTPDNIFDLLLGSSSFI
ncbi:hypothetical protein MRB53_016405 [Persea americana]|uniref:Uncharacterized protein n=1 Tax=Persea americana TaxID=3435 RepID=A0ACC2M310_PERAE|nr:hypothetical protein MRB53_016405 [Persea americana]